MLRVGFEPMIPVFEWEKTFRSLDLPVTVIGRTAHYLLNRVFQKERSIFWEVIVSVIVSKIYTEIEIFHCTDPKLLIRKRYYPQFLKPVFIVQVKNLVQFT
jgi:hypothetical protein